ncbi:MAG TPA: stage V sporulation protein AC [Firmicutes bacterium]|nr:stage V sporulation protein AC [Bacillota bacterium]
MKQQIPSELNITPQEFKEIVRKSSPKRPLLKNLIFAFLSGGTICLIGQAIQNLYTGFGFSNQEATSATVSTVIFAGSLLTGLGVFDKIARFAGAGSAIPVTGFANSLTSAALEFKKEGLVAGLSSKMFILAGSVIVFGVVTAFVVGIIKALLS